MRRPLPTRPASKPLLTVRIELQSGGRFEKIGISAVPRTGWYLGTSFIDRHVINGRKYFYRIVAVNGFGKSRPEAAVSGKPGRRVSNPLRGKVIGTAARRAAAFDGNLCTCSGPFKLGCSNYRGARLGIYCYNNCAQRGYFDVDYFQYIFPRPGN